MGTFENKTGGVRLLCIRRYVERQIPDARTNGFTLSTPELASEQHLPIQAGQTVKVSDEVKADLLELTDYAVGEVPAPRSQQP